MRRTLVALSSPATVRYATRGTGQGQLDDDGVAVLVGDGAGQPVRFGMDQAQTLLAAQFRQRLAARHRGSDAALEESVVDRFPGIEDQKRARICDCGL